MPASVRRVTVVGSVRRLDLAVPGSAPVAELLPDVVALAGEPVPADALCRWVLTRVGAGDLPAEESLESAGVPDGSVLHLRRVDEPEVGLQGVDVVERATVAGSGSRPPTVDRVLLASAASAVLVVLAGLLLYDASPASSLAAVALGLAVLAGGLRLESLGREGTATSGAVLALTAAPLLGAAAAAAAPGLAAPDRAALGLAAVGLGALLAAAAVRRARVSGAALAGLAATGCLSTLLTTRLSLAQAAGVAAVGGALAVPALPRVVLRLCGVRLSHHEQAAAAGAGELEQARRALPWALAVASAVVLGGAVGLSLAAVRAGGSGAALPLAAVCGLVVVLRSRQRRGSAEALPLAVGGHLALVAAGAGLALSRPHQVGPPLVLAAVAAAYVAAAAVPAGSVDTARWAQRRRRLEGLALVASIPLLAAVLGLFGAVLELARGAE